MQGAMNEINPFVCLVREVLKDIGIKDEYR